MTTFDLLAIAGDAIESVRILGHNVEGVWTEPQAGGVVAIHHGESFLRLSEGFQSYVGRLSRALCAIGTETWANLQPATV
jgi:hypothetical protein